MKRVLAIAGITLVAIIGLAVLLVWTFFDADEIGRVVLDDLEDRTGLEIHAASFQFGLFDGLRVEGLAVEGDIEPGYLEASVEAAVFEHRIGALLRGDVVFDRVEIRSPDVRLTARSRSSILGRGGPAAERTTGDRSGVLLAVTNVEIIEGRFQSGEGKNGAASNGLGLRLTDLSYDSRAASPIESVGGQGTIRVDELTLGELVGREGRGKLELHRGHVLLDRFNFDHNFGILSADIDVDFTRAPFTYVLGVDGESLDLAPALDATAAGAVIPATLEFNATGIGPEPEELAGRGFVKIEGGEIPASPVVSSVEFILGGGVKIAGARYDPAEVRFEIEDNRVEIVPFSMRFEDLHLDVEGGVDLDGPLGIRLRVRTPREVVKIRELPDEFYDVLTNDDGEISVPLDIGGTMDDPKVSLDWSDLAKTTGQHVGRRLEDLLIEGLGKLFSKDD